LVAIPENSGGEVRAFQVLRPPGWARENTPVNFLKHVDLSRRQLIAHRDDEVDIAVAIEVANCKGALQVCTDEGLSERDANARDQVPQDLI